VSGPRYRLIALHGFLGQASDWDGLAPRFPDAVLSALDLWPIVGDPGVSDWPSLARDLDRAIRDARGGLDGVPAFLVAYSFGARLALAIDDLGSADGAVCGCCLVSCSPGLPWDDRDLRARRRASDEAWAERIVRAPEDEIWRAWDAQPVLAGSARPQRREGLPAPRATLARTLRLFSLADQPDHRARLLTWRAPLLWVTGSADTTFTAIAGELSDAGVAAEFVTCAQAGHRVPWDNPSGFASIVRDWVDRCLSR